MTERGRGRPSNKTSHNRIRILGDKINEEEEGIPKKSSPGKGTDQDWPRRVGLKT